MVSPRNSKQAGAATGKSFPVGLVGERNYQAAIGRCRPGDRLLLWHEPDNPYDDQAIAVATPAGATIGYIAQDSWVHRALLREAKGCAATVQSIRSGGAGQSGVVIALVLSGATIAERAFKS